MVGVLGVCRRWLVRLGCFHRVLLSMNRRNVEYVYPYNPRRYFLLADDKVLAKEWLCGLGVPVPATYLLIEAFGEIGLALGVLRRFDRFVVKPARGSGGRGLLLVVNRGGRWETPGGKLLPEQFLRQHIADILFGNYSFGLTDRALVEEFIEPHSVFRGIFPEGVPDIRVIVFCGEPVLAMVRLPTVRSGGRANLHQGGLGVAVDLATGKMLYGLWKGRYVTRHPDTGKPIAGVVLPYWEEVIGIVRRIGAHSPLRYLGLDVVLREGGPVVMEMNVRPGLEIQNVTRSGLRELLEGMRG